MTTNLEGPELETDHSPVTEAQRPARFLRRLVRRPMGLFMVVLLGVLILLAVLAPVIAPYDPERADLTALLQGPSADHWFGTDQLGRDMLSRVLFGMRLSLLSALGAMAIGAVIGVPGGLLAGYLGGWTDTLSSRVVDAIMAIPGLIFALTVIAVLGPGLGNVMLAIGLLLIPTFFRVTRASVLDVRHNVYVEASVAIGCPTWRVTLAHVLPNAAPPILVQATLSFAIAVIAEAGLSFLGLGARPPAASLGRLLAEATGRMDVAHLLYVPGVAILLVVASATLLGDVLRDMASERERT